MPLDPQCDQSDNCGGAFYGDELIVEDGCPVLCFSVFRKNLVGDDGVIYSGICDPDVDDIIDGASGEISVYTIISNGPEMVSGSLFGYGETEAVGLMTLLTDNDASLVLPGDVIQPCATGGELLLVLEVGPSRTITVQRAYGGTQEQDWPARAKMKLYRIFRAQAIVDPEQGTLCYHWTRAETSTPGNFGAFVELVLADGTEYRLPRVGGFKVRFA